MYIYVPKAGVMCFVLCFRGIWHVSYIAQTCHTLFKAYTPLHVTAFKAYTSLHVTAFKVYTSLHVTAFKVYTPLHVTACHPWVEAEG